jgi:hypothetical protein
MAEKDVYDLIVEICETSMNSMKNCSNMIELASSYQTTISTIIGVCAGAKSRKKELIEKEIK